MTALYVETGPDGHLYHKPRFIGRDATINLSCSPARLISSSDFSPPSCAPVRGARDFSTDTHPNEAADGHGPGPILTRAVQACGGSSAERRAGDGRNRVIAGHALPVRGTVGCDSGPRPGDQGAAKCGDVTSGGGENRLPLRDRAAAARLAHNQEVASSNLAPAIQRPRRVAITPGAVAHAARRILPDALGILVRIGWMVVGAAAWAAIEIT